ncbi:hypothetical protein [Paractinoplanes hotanensis]|uniref:Uncharacterized protein n=1 Tax=Paractinoplanes hotanensis TaxID=2906497 RepID=A0ABT0Y5C4_9ACTN|nr:hypothetical protein [Actinoplanes hotanensis]MCM4081235.1 hypothetical protein [Actinoplanes hotanensis]
MTDEQSSGRAEALPDSNSAVLTMARRTAEEYVAVAEERARKMRAGARASAERTRSDARLCAEKIRSTAEDALTEAQAEAVRNKRDATRRAADIRHQAELVLTEAHVEAEQILAAGRDEAERLRLRAQQRYEDTVGVLPAKRAALLKQIEDLKSFGSQYRQQLIESIQQQSRLLRAAGPEAAAKKYGLPARFPEHARELVPRP